MEEWRPRGPKERSQRLKGETQGPKGKTEEAEKKDRQGRNPEIDRTICEKERVARTPNATEGTTAPGTATQNSEAEGTRSPRHGHVDLDNFGK